MLTRILTVTLFLTIMGLLVAQRFYLPPELLVIIQLVEGESLHRPGDRLDRGEVIHTADEYLHVSMGDRTSIWLAQDTTVELHRLYEDQQTVILTRGRIVVEQHGDIPMTVDTNDTSNKVLNDIVSFVNYDFLETIHVIPLSGAVQVYIESTGESLLTPIPLSIHETDPISYDTLEVNLSSDDVRNFYQWVGVLQTK